MYKKVSQQLQVCYLGFLCCRQTVARDSYKWVSYKKGFGCWWVVVHIFWLVVSGAAWVVVDIFWLVEGDGEYILAGGGWWWIVVSGGIVQSDPNKKPFTPIQKPPKKTINQQ